MELKLLRTFLTVTELRHFSRAADARHMSQPALSKQIGALEASLGGRLFERGRHGAALTPFGERFLSDAQALVRDADEILSRAREASSGRRGHLRIGICLSVLTIVPRLIAEFRRQHPDVAVTLSDLSSAEQARRMLAGKLDAGFMRLPPGDELSSFKVVDEALALALPPQLRHTRVPADLDALNEIGFIALQRARGAGLAAQVDRWCIERGFVPNVTQQAEDVQSVLTSVAAGVGVAFIPSRAQHLLRDATVLPLPGKHAKWRVGLAWPSTRDDPVTSRFVSFVRAAMKGA
ncbi:LysR family transcriptional regulator [Burkholderia ubonensis]|uniref:LysR family transcriptional regulator n=1 Tax=Burkholderia ubonensis TaxID=101571 RepID=UPI000756151F|nr:LysR substrate-binding domain-containing protein [Burkholderia ubonensis]KVM17050.1 LysR family transcriptional regulator [Burkholderia ubonensis]KVM18762.1 LysR family transcriptional regulator [Burkholderia ubonensis]KVM42303.1 LysR family transcriptional regulator [Burkholderia ubonensis]KVX62390.1 LysR family transcriptional regulator [Burkholderia ubonensis]